MGINSKEFPNGIFLMTLNGQAWLWDEWPERWGPDSEIDQYLK